MSRLASLKPEFVEYVPKELEDGVLYVSIQFSTAVHKCACGCGSKVTTPLSPARWILTFDGETVSLHPSIGNWSYPCESHYWIDHDRIRWASAWSREQIAAGRTRDRMARERHYERLQSTRESEAEMHDVHKEGDGIIRRVWQRLTRSRAH